MFQYMIKKYWLHFQKEYTIQVGVKRTAGTGTTRRYTLMSGVHRVQKTKIAINQDDEGVSSFQVPPWAPIISEFIYIALVVMVRLVRYGSPYPERYVERTCVHMF